jgi:hypothetical protein
MDDIQKLLAIENIKQLKAAYFRTMDTKAWDEFRELFTVDVMVDSSEAFTPLDATGEPIEVGLPRCAPDQKLCVWGVDDFIRMQHRHLEGISTVHHGHMPEITIISDDEANGVWAMEDKLRWPEGQGTVRELHGYGHYQERYRKVDGRWRIAH